MTGSSRPRQRQGLRSRVLGDEVVILDRRCERIHQLNRTAAAIWVRCDARELAETFEVDAARAEADVAATLGELATLGLLEPPASP
jgi:Coenzyme PQQ synthesis protein D (PqqD)